jgi:hypothetical protein
VPERERGRMNRLWMSAVPEGDEVGWVFSDGDRENQQLPLERYLKRKTVTG